MVALPLVASSCHDDKDDDDINSITQSDSYSIVGEWYEDANTEDTNGYGISIYNIDGTAEFVHVHVSSSINLYCNYEGNYSVKGSLLQENYISPITGQNQTDKYNIIYLDKYTQICSLESLGEVGELARIISTYTMSPEEIKKFEIDDDNFKIFEYFSSDSRIAIVDESGNITAKNRGVAYITAKSTIGNAVIRICVDDDENLIEEFLRWMNKDINEVKNYYGKTYKDVAGNGINELQFNIADEYIENIAFDYAMRKIWAINVTYRESADLNKIADFFDNKYDLKFSSNSLRTYLTDYDGIRYYIMFDLSMGMMIYMPYSEPDEPDNAPIGEDSDYEGNDLYIGQSVTDLASSIGYELTTADMENGFFDINSISNNVFDNISILFDESESPYIVHTVMLMAKKNITQENLEPWYKKHFISTGDDLNPYSNEAGNVFVTFKKSGSRTYVYYKDRKVRK